MPRHDYTCFKSLCDTISKIKKKNMTRVLTITTSKCQIINAGSRREISC